MVIPHIFPNTLVSCTLIALSLQNTHHFLNFLNILHLCHPVWLHTHWNGRIFVKVLQGNAELDLILSSWRSNGPGNDRRKHIPTTKRVEKLENHHQLKSAGTGDMLVLLEGNHIPRYST